jgi:competence protein ComEC
LETFVQWVGLPSHFLTSLSIFLSFASLQFSSNCRNGAVFRLIVVFFNFIVRLHSPDWALFRNTGVSHLLSVSGLHVTMFAWLAQAVVASLWRRSARLCIRCPAPTAARWMGVMAALAYALFSGWGVPAQRTVWMLLSLALLRSLGLRWPWPLCLLASALLVTLIDPWAVGQAGFWLSFAAVGLLMATGGSDPQPKNWHARLRQGLRSQWVATLGLAPLSLLFFQQISLVGLLANLVAIPLVSFVITPLALAGALLPGLWWLAEVAVRALMLSLQALAAWPWAVWFVAAAPFWAQVLGLLGGSLLVLPLPWRLRLCGLGLLMPMLWPAPPRPPVGEFELLAADVGQGTALLLRTAEHQLLYDSGPVYGTVSDAGQRVLLPLMRALGVNRLDTLMLSHRDSDHVGGAASILAGMPVHTLLSSLETGHRLLSGTHQARPQRCEQGQNWIWDGVQFEVLHPPPELYEASPAHKSNAMSCVLRVSSSSGRSALLTGDLEAPQEQALVEEQSNGRINLQSEVLIAPHHGSKTSSSEAFLAAVAPRVAAFQAGYRNRFGHPALSVLARYQAQGIEARQQATCGAWTWQSGSGSERCQREERRRFWHLSPVISQPTDPTVAGPWPQVMPAEEAELLSPP